ncbi:MAG: hypothetical protein QM644_14000 [Mobilitalea sp.]
MRHKKKSNYTKVILVGMFIYLILFTCACLYITYKTSVEPDTLILSVFAFCGIEGGLSAWIKITKVKNCDNENTKES